jgi:hypothetical protein
MIEQAKAVAQRLRNAEVVLFSKDADTIDALVQEVEQLKHLHRIVENEWQNRYDAQTAEVERLRELDDIAYALEAILQRVGPEATVADVIRILERLKQEQAEPVSCPYCHNSATLGAVYYDQTCAGCVKRMTAPKGQTELLRQVQAFLNRVTHWQEGKPDLHDIKVAVKAALGKA